MKKLLLFPFFVFVALAVAGAWFFVNLQPVSATQTFQSFVISKGDTASGIGTKLESGGLIRSALVFKIYLKLFANEGALQAGSYRLSPSFNVSQTISVLSKGPVEIWVTIPEGLRREEIAAKFAMGLDKPQSFISEFLTASSGNEGYLFPDTYTFSTDATASQIVTKMLATFKLKTANLSITKDDVILASILERETRTDTERPIVAGILENRMNIGMGLQIDATVQYAVASAKYRGQSTKYDWWPSVTPSELRFNSPYNTYVVRGLPPSPISNPGLSTLQAAISPTKSNYLYYLHDSNGQIHYAETLKEQNANIAKYLR